MVDENNHDNCLIPNVEDIPFEFEIIYKEKFHSNLDVLNIWWRVEFM